MNNFFGRKAFRHVAWKYRRNFLIAIISLLVIGEGISQTVQYSDDFSFLKAPDPLSGSNPTFPLVTLPEPEIGAPFLDPNFKTVLTRVTRTDGYEGRHEYSRYDPFNVDQSMIILVSDAGDYFIYKTNPLPFNQQQNHVMTLSAMEPRWDAENPNLLWAVDEFSIVTVDVAAGQRTIVKDFSQDPVLGPIITSNSAMWITWRYEGEASMDKRYWAFLLQADDRLDYAYINMFTWDRLNDEILGVYSIADNEQSIDWIGMSPLGNFVLIGADPWNGGNVVDLTIANKELTLFHQLANGAGHSDVGLDINGNEVIVVQNARTDHVDMIPLDWGTNPVPENGEYQGTGVTPLILLFYNSESP
ncbi:MAG: hypothetical protein JXR73_05485, partial [Candidatus Omnitrophica bacterium]|nr:hypothetical protein [Candidatus Omnitrophota bacterium]